MLSVFPETVATLPPFVKFNSRDDAIPGLLLVIVLLEMTTTTDVALVQSQNVAAVPLLGIAPTFAVHLEQNISSRSD